MKTPLSRVARRAGAASAVVVLAIGLTACSAEAGGSASGSKSGQDTAGTILIMNQPAGNPFADLVFSGLQKLEKETGVPAKQVPGVQAGAYEQQLRSAATNGFNPVMVLWDDLGNAVGKVANDFPKTKFIIVDSTVDPKLKNVQSLTIDTVKPAYLAGVVGTHLSKTGKLGFVGGQDMGVVNQYRCGFEAGVKSAAPSDTVTTTYAGTFTDPLKGQQIAASLKGDGVDVILQAANQTGLGVLKGAAQTGIFGIGSDSWQGDIAKGSVPWSALKDAGTAAYQVARDVLDKKFQAGPYVYDAAKGAPLYDERDLNALEPDLQATVKKVEAELRAGTINVAC